MPPSEDLDFPSIEGQSAASTESSEKNTEDFKSVDEATGEVDTTLINEVNDESPQEFDYKTNSGLDLNTMTEAVPQNYDTNATNTVNANDTSDKAAEASKPISENKPFGRCRSDGKNL